MSSRSKVTITLGPSAQVLYSLVFCFKQATQLKSYQSSDRIPGSRTGISLLHSKKEESLTSPSIIFFPYFVSFSGSQDWRNC
jgi:hypothetical protein